MPTPIVAQPTGNSKLQPPTEPQPFTIRCAECADDLGEHLPECPGVLAASYDTAGNGAFSSTVYPRAGGNFASHDHAIGALRFYAMWGPVELHLEDGTVVSFMALYDGLDTDPHIDG